jgi:hypothetical protein
MGKIKNKSSYEPGTEIVFYRTEQCDLKIKFGANECPMVYLVQVLGDHNLTSAVIVNSSINLLYLLSHTGSC